MTQEQNDNALPGLNDQQDGNGEIVRAIEENTRVLHDIKAALELLIESAAAKKGRTPPDAKPSDNSRILAALKVYKACPDTGIFARADVIASIEANYGTVTDRRRLSDYIVALAGVQLLARCGEKAAARYMKVPGIDEPTALKKISSATFLNTLSHSGKREDER